MCSAPGGAVDHFLQPFSIPWGDSSRASALAHHQVTHLKIQWLVKIYTPRRTSRDNQGTSNVIQLCGATEGPVLLGRV